MLSLLFKSRKFLPLYFKAWKYIYHLQMMKSHSSFLLNFHNDLLGSMGLILRYFDSLSTNKCGDYLMLSEQSQKLIKLLGFLLKNFLRSFNIAIECNWYGCNWYGSTDISKIHLAARIASVMTIIYE